MDRFVSNVTLGLDYKGRVSLPATFPTALSCDGFESAYCYPALDCFVIDVGGNALAAGGKVSIMQYASHAKESEQLVLAPYGTSETKIDA